MQIKEGCYYKSQNNVIFGPMRKVLDDLFVCERIGEQFKGNGDYHNRANVVDSDRFNLISECSFPMQDYASRTIFKQKNELFIKNDDGNIYKIVFTEDGNLVSKYVDLYELEKISKDDFEVLTTMTRE